MTANTTSKKDNFHLEFYFTQCANFKCWILLPATVFSKCSRSLQLTNCIVPLRMTLLYGLEVKVKQLII